MREGAARHPRGVLADEVFPPVVSFFAGHGRVGLEEVAVGRGEGVGGVHEVAHLRGGDAEHAAEHVAHLLLAGAAVAGDGHLYLQRGVFRDGDVAAQGGRYGHALGAPQLEHRLHVFPEEGGFDGHLVGQEPFDDAGHAVVYVLELEICVLALAQVDDAHRHERRPVARDAQQAVAHDVRARVDAQYDSFFFRFCHFLFVIPGLSGKSAAAVCRKRCRFFRKALPVFRKSPAAFFPLRRRPAPGARGGTSSLVCSAAAINLSAAGGYPGVPSGPGGNGGSGGGGSNNANGAAGSGGSNGSNGFASAGGSGTSPTNGGIGQGSTTREFGEAGGTLYAGGGGGGFGNSDAGRAGGAGGGGTGGGWSGPPATNGQPNTGGGAGGNGHLTGVIAAGGSGIVIIRNHR